jgi:uncharacterized protein YciI
VKRLIQKGIISRKKMPDYIYLIHPLRHDFFEHPTPQEEAAMEAHFQYLKQATAEDVVILAGPCLDDTFGVIIFRAENDEAARAFMLNDPSVLTNVMMAEMHPMRISLMKGC